MTTDSLNMYLKEIRQYPLLSIEEEKELIGAFAQLNKAGQAIAIERIKELTEIYKYQKL